MHLPESGAYETVAGLLISRLGRMPENFDSVEVVATMDASSFLGVPDGQVGQPDDQPIAPDTEDDLPRAVTVRLTVHRRARRRIERWCCPRSSAERRPGRRRRRVMRRGPCAVIAR